MNLKSMDSSQDINAESIVVRFAGDSGDGVQLMGTQFVASTALSGRDFATFPDYPAEIRAPVGTTFGVSAYQINLGARPITTAGDAPKVLVAFNPAALKVNLGLVEDGALIVINTDNFTQRNLAKAGYTEDPRTSGELDSYQLVEVDVTGLTLEARFSPRTQCDSATPVTSIANCTAPSAVLHRHPTPNVERARLASTEPSLNSRLPTRLASARGTTGHGPNAARSSMP